MNREFTKKITTTSSIDNSYAVINYNFYTLDTALVDLYNMLTKARIPGKYQKGNTGADAYGIPGLITAFAGTIAPDNWLICNGAEVSKADYKELYKAIGNTYGTATDLNNFLLPNLQTDISSYVALSTIDFALTGINTWTVPDNLNLLTLNLSGYGKIFNNKFSFTNSTGDFNSTNIYVQPGDILTITNIPNKEYTASISYKYTITETDVLFSVPQGLTDVIRKYSCGVDASDGIVYNTKALNFIISTGTTPVPTHQYTLHYFTPHVVVTNSPVGYSRINNVSLSASVPATVETRLSPFIDANTRKQFSTTVNIGTDQYIMYCDAMHFGESFYIDSANLTDPYYVEVAPIFPRPEPVPYDTVIYIANRSDDLYGSGTKFDPYNGTLYFDEIMSHLCGYVDLPQAPITRNPRGPAYRPTNICIYLSAGSFTTCGGRDHAFGYKDRWFPMDNWTLSGSGPTTVLYLSGLSRFNGDGALDVNGIRTGNDERYGFCASNFIIDGVTKSNAIKTITSFVYTHADTYPLTVTTLQPHGLSAGPNIIVGGDKFSTSNYSWRIGSTQYCNDRDYHFEWKTMEVVNDYTLKAKLISGYGGDGSTWNSTNGHFISDFTPVQDSPGLPEMRIANSCPLVIRNSGHNIYYQLTAYGLASIYENLGIVSIQCVGNYPNGFRWSKNNLINNCVAVTIPHPGEPKARNGTNFGWTSNNNAWGEPGYTVADFEADGGSNSWLSLIVTNNLSLSASQAFGGYGTVNTLVDSNTAYNCEFGFFDDTAINVGTYITNNKFYANNWGIFIGGPVWRNGVIANNYLYGGGASDVIGGNGIEMRIYPNQVINGVARSFANTTIYDNTILNWFTPIALDTDEVNTITVPLSARATYFNNITS